MDRSVGNPSNSPYQGRTADSSSRDGNMKDSRIKTIFLPYDPILIEKARENRKQPTTAEQKMWRDVLRCKQIKQFKFLRQKPIDHFIVDFYCSQLLLALEIDGDTHALQEEYDKRRTERLGAFGIQVIRYTNDDVITNTIGVAEDLIQKINERKTEIFENHTNPTYHGND